MDTIAVLIPCYNEALTIRKVVEDYRRCLPEAVVYVYDNNSTDDTAAIAAEAATQMAMDMNIGGLANMILLGAVIEKTGCVNEQGLADALHKVIPARKADLFDSNMTAIRAGKEYVS